MSQTRRLVFGRDPRRTAIRIAVLAAASFVTFGWLLTPTRVRGVSMQPSYEDGTLNLVNRVIYRIRPPRRGEVVGIRLAGPNVIYVKRIIGLPGERVSISDGIVAIDGEPLAESYVERRAAWDYGEVTVGPREYFVVGDNRSMRIEDHDFGRVDARRILGPLVF